MASIGHLGDGPVCGVCLWCAAFLQIPIGFESTVRTTDFGIRRLPMSLPQLPRRHRPSFLAELAGKQSC